MKCDVIDGAIVDGLKQQIIYSFILDKPPGYKVICKRETKTIKKLYKSVLNTITLCLQNNKNKEVDFNAETLTFTLQLKKTLTI